MCDMSLETSNFRSDGYLGTNRERRVRERGAKLQNFKRTGMHYLETNHSKEKKTIGFENDFFFTH